ncbi:MAG TPA: hypothetical protein VIU61_07890 [Kofleriaceae bacterium]
MVRLLGLVLGLCVVMACDSKQPGAGDKASDRAGDKAKPTKAEKAAKSAKQFDEQLIDPPADVIAALGVEVYPGARMLKGFTAMRTEAKDHFSVDYIFFTTDPAAKVRDFYAGKLTAVKPTDPMFEKMGTFVVKGTNANGEDVHVQSRSLGAKTDFHFVITKKK